MEQETQCDNQAVVTTTAKITPPDASKVSEAKAKAKQSRKDPPELKWGNSVEI